MGLLAKKKLEMSFPRAHTGKPCISDFVADDHLLGDGNFCRVYRTKDAFTTHLVAFKVLPKREVTRLHKEKDVIMEKHALSRLDHPNILKILYTFSDSFNCYIVTELCAGGEWWGQCRKSGEPEVRAAVYFRQILNGLAYLHRMGIVHRDLKAENIFLSADGQHVKIGDLGSARDLYNPSITGAGNGSASRLPGRNRSVMDHYVGSPNFISPEAIANKENDEVSDIWSLGCLFYQALVGIPPFVAGSDYLVYLRVRALDLQFPEHGISPQAIDLVRSILKHERSERPSIKQIDGHAFFDRCALRVPPMTPIDTELRRIARDSDIVIDDAFITAFGDDAYKVSRVRMIRAVREWNRLAQPGNGTEILQHLNLPECNLGSGIPDDVDSSSSSSPDS